MRVFELAKKVDLPSKKLIPELKSLGAIVKNHMSVIEEEYVQKIISRYLPGEGNSRNVSSRGRTMVLIKKKAKPEPEPVVEVESINAQLAVVDTETVVAEVVSGETLPIKEDSEEATKEVAEQELAAVEKPKVPEAEVVGNVKTEAIADKVPEPAVKAPVDKPIEEQKKQKTGEAIVKPVIAQVEKKPVKPIIKKKGKKPSVEPATAVAGKPSKAKLLELQKKFVEEAAIPSGVGKFKRNDRKVKGVAAKEFFDYSKSSRKWRGKKGGKGGGKHGSGTGTSTIERKKEARFKEGGTVKEFSDVTGRKVSEIIKQLMELGIMATVNQGIDKDTALILAEEFGMKLTVRDKVTEEEMIGIIEDNSASLSPKQPVITIMGHVDHGKTSLLDAIRNTAVADREAGGITQHIGAYEIDHNGKGMTFLDTPGHEAFTSMRARGANITDIVLLLIAADDGVMPQTIEAINHARAAESIMLVVINKIDKPGANIDRVKNQLMEHEMISEDLGGDTVICEVSAKSKIGIDHLLDMIQLQVDMLELTVNPDKRADGVIVEARLDRSKGAIATVLIQGGTLNVGDPFIVGTCDGKVRTLTNDLGLRITTAGPSTPVEVTGMSGVPRAGDKFVVVKDEKTARVIMENRTIANNENNKVKVKKITLDNLFDELKESNLKELSIIIKADVHGSSEALKESLVKLSTEKVELRVIHTGVGGITETDVTLASASRAIIIGFNVRPEPQASRLAEVEGVDVRLYSVIYKALEEVKDAMEGLLEPTIKEVVLGRLEVRNTFTASKIGTIAGSYVVDGMISRNCMGIRVIRDNVLIFEGRLGSLKRFKDDVKEVATGYECGVVVENYNDIKVGDILEVYNQEKIATKL